MKIILGDDFQWLLVVASLVGAAVIGLLTGRLTGTTLFSSALPFMATHKPAGAYPKPGFR